MKKIAAEDPTYESFNGSCFFPLSVRHSPGLQIAVAASSGKRTAVRGEAHTGSTGAGALKAVKLLKTI